MKSFFRRLFCFHTVKYLRPVSILGEYVDDCGYDDCYIRADCKIIYSSPWSLFGTRLIKFKCSKCGSHTYMTFQGFSELKMHDKLLNLLNNTN